MKQHYWILRSGHYGAGATYVGSDMKKARQSAARLSIQTGDDVRVYEGSETSFHIADPLIGTFFRITSAKSGGKWRSVK